MPPRTANWPGPSTCWYRSYPEALSKASIFSRGASCPARRVSLLLLSSSGGWYIAGRRQYRRSPPGNPHPAFRPLPEAADAHIPWTGPRRRKLKSRAGYTRAAVPMDDKSLQSRWPSPSSEASTRLSSSSGAEGVDQMGLMDPGNAGHRRGSIVALHRRHKGFIFSYPI